MFGLKKRLFDENFLKSILKKVSKLCGSKSLDDDGINGIFDYEECILDILEFK